MGRYPTPLIPIVQRPSRVVSVAIYRKVLLVFPLRSLLHKGLRERVRLLENAVLSRSSLCPEFAASISFKCGVLPLFVAELALMYCVVSADVRGLTCFGRAAALLWGCHSEARLHSHKMQRPRAPSFAHHMRMHMRLYI